MQANGGFHLDLDGSTGDSSLIIHVRGPVANRTQASGRLSCCAVDALLRFDLDYAPAVGRQGRVAVIGDFQYDMDGLSPRVLWSNQGCPGRG